MSELFHIIISEFWVLIKHKGERRLRLWKPLMISYINFQICSCVKTNFPYHYICISAFTCMWVFAGYTLQYKHTNDKILFVWTKCCHIVFVWTKLHNEFNYKDKIFMVDINNYFYSKAKCAVKGSPCKTTFPPSHKCYEMQKHMDVLICCTKTTTVSPQQSIKALSQKFSLYYLYMHFTQSSPFLSALCTIRSENSCSLHQQGWPPALCCQFGYLEFEDTFYNLH